MKPHNEFKKDTVEILIAEDSPTQAEQLRYILESHHYSVAIARNGREAIDNITNHKPTIVISDITMPEMDGYELCRRIKANQHLKDIPVILLTALSDPLDVLKGLECGADNFITKPYEERYLLSRINYLLVNREMRRNQSPQFGLEIFFGGEKRLITADRAQILDLFISTYEVALQKNEEMTAAQADLQKLNEQLEEKVKERTAALEIEIAERARAQEALRQAEEKYRKIFERAVEGIFQISPQGRFIAANPAMARMLGYNSPEELLALPTGVQEQFYIEPESQEQVRHLLTEQGVAQGVELQIRRKDGTSIWVAGNAQVVRSESGEVMYFEGAIEDVTERKELQEQLLHSQKMEAIGVLAGGVAHDFNNLLTVIVGYGQLALQRLRPTDPLYEELSIILNAADRASMLTRQLLAFSRRQVLQPKAIDLNAVIGDVEKMLRRLIGEDIDFVTLLDPEVGQVYADPGQIGQVLVNLVVNARAAMPDGGKLIIETSNAYLNEEYAQHHAEVTPGQYVMLAVSDNGIGMNAETKSRIFEPFFTTKPSGQGTGLGLATIYGIVKQSEGHIWVYSEPSQGTTFKIYLPHLPETIAEVEPSEQPAQTSAGQETILIVEDDDSLRVLGRKILTASGYKVLEAMNGNEALALVEEFKESIDLVVTDVVMPHMSGRELAHRINALAPKIKILHTSGYTDHAIMQHGVLGKGTFFLQKPYTIESLTRKVREVLDDNEGTSAVIFPSELS
ncbi:MAG: response regulator [Acidobacteriota bacterium]